MSPAQALREAEAYREMTVVEQMLYEKGYDPQDVLKEWDWEVWEEINREWE